MICHHPHKLPLFQISLFFACTLTIVSTPVKAQEFPGGFLEQPSSASPRPIYSSTQLQNILPVRGKFTFPAPYNTTAVRLTTDSDCNGEDCVRPVGYAYWNNMNNHVGLDNILIFTVFDKSKGGAGPSLLQYNKNTDAIQNLGPLFDSNSGLSWSTGEGWYFSDKKPNALYINNGSVMYRYDVLAKSFETVYDINTLLGSGHYLWQMHSSGDDRVHSATVRRDGTWEMLGCVTYNEETKLFLYYPRIGQFDECQVDKSGKWLLIKEDIDGINGEDNRIINLETLQERILLDADGAAGHSDLGYGYMIAADNFANDANTQKLWDFNAATLNGKVVYRNSDWNIAAPSHVSHSNALPGVVIDKQYACGSSANRSNTAEANEVVCFGFDGSDQALVVAPVMTDLNASGGGDDYFKSPKGNLDVTGRYFLWTSNTGGSRLDYFMVKVPAQKLTGSLVVTDPVVTDPVVTEPVVSDPVVTDPVAPAPSTDDDLLNTHFVNVPWSNLVNTTASNGTLTKTGGCDGCADASAVSSNGIKSGDGYMEFTLGDPQKMHSTGLSISLAGTSAGQIDFALRILSGYAEVRENGVYRSDISVSYGDVMRISVQNGTVRYARNGTVFYTSTAVPVWPLRVYSTLNSSGSTVGSAKLSGALQSYSTQETTPTLEKSQLVNVPWANLVNAIASGGTLRKSGGCDGCEDAGGVSSNGIKSGNGYMEFTVNDTQKMLQTGLSISQEGTRASQIDFSFRILSGYAEVRENGVYRSDVAINNGDVLRISVQNGNVSYARNGIVFYTSTVVPVWPLRAYATLYSSNSRIRSAKLSGVLQAY